MVSGVKGLILADISRESVYTYNGMVNMTNANDAIAQAVAEATRVQQYRPWLWQDKK